MKNLLICEMKRAIQLLEKRTPKEGDMWEQDKERAEIKDMLKAVRRHSIMVEKEL